MDHSTPTRTEQVFGGVPITRSSLPRSRSLQLERNCAEFGVELLGLRSDLRGIVHIIGPELGLDAARLAPSSAVTVTPAPMARSARSPSASAPPKSGTCLPLNAFCSASRRRWRSKCPIGCAPGVTAKDLILAIIGRIGVAGGTGHVIEYRGDAIRALDMEERMTVCNMSIEAGARAGMIAPDETTYRICEDRPRAPQGSDWDRALEAWRQLPGDAGATLRQGDRDRCRRRWSP